MCVRAEGCVVRVHMRTVDTHQRVCLYVYETCVVCVQLRIVGAHQRVYLCVCMSV